VEHVLGQYMRWQQTPEIALEAPCIALVELFEGVWVTNGQAVNEFLVVRLRRGGRGQSDIRPGGRTGRQ
jgi:hypothetical protein